MFLRIGLCLGFFLFIGTLRAGVLVLSVDQILKHIWNNNAWLKSLNIDAQRLRYEALALNDKALPSVGLGTFASPLITGPNRAQIYPYIQLQFQHKILFNTKTKEQKAYLRAMSAANNNNKEIYFNDLRVEVKKLCFDWIIALREIDTLHYYLNYLQLMKKTEEQNLNQENIGKGNSDEITIEKSINAIALAEVKITEMQNLITSLLAKSDYYRYTLNSMMEREADFMFVIDTTELNIALISSDNFDSSNLIYYRKDLQKMDKLIDALQLKMYTLSPNNYKPEIQFTFQPLFSVHRGLPHLFNFMAQASIPIFGQHALSLNAQRQNIHLQIRALNLARVQEFKKIQSKLYALETKIDLSKHKIQIWEQKILPKLRQIFRSHLNMYELNQVTLITLLEDWESLKNASLKILDEQLNIWKTSAEYEGEVYK